MECSICPYNINSRNESGTGCGENVCINEQILNENEQFYEENVSKFNVLSLFDGISCGRVALERAKIPVNKYYASEIDRYAIQVTQDNYPDTIQLGDVTKWREWDIDWGSIDLLIGGSPCQGFSNAGKGLNFDDPRSALFFVFVDILNHIRNVNPNVKFLLENVKMKKEWVNVITEYLGVEPVEINSSLLSAQNRARMYWTNIAKIPQPTDKNIYLQDILENIQQEEQVGKFKNCVRKNVVKQLDQVLNSSKIIYQLNCDSGWQDNRIGIIKAPTLRAGNSFCLVKTLCNKIRTITPVEAERLQTLPDNYTASISSAQRYKCLGNGWTVDVIAHIFNSLKGE